MRKELISILIRQYWVVLMLILGILGILFAMMRNNLNEESYEIESLPTSFEGEIKLYDQQATNAYARFVHADTPDSGEKVIFIVPNLSFEPGDYQISYTVKALVIAGEQPLRLEVIDLSTGEILDSHTTATQRLNTDTYEEISFDISVDTYIPAAELRAFLPDQGAYWFDYVKIRRLTNSPWNRAYIYWPILVGFLAISLVINQRKFHAGVSLNEVLKNPSVDHYLVIIANVVLVGIGLFSLAGKYFFDIERIIYAYVADDAFYYFETAANIAQKGQMSFDGLTFSNGFHPLWVLVLVPIFWLGFNQETTLYVVLILADVIGLAATLLLFKVLRARLNIFLAFLMTLLYFSQILFPLQFGLETAVLIGVYIALLAFYDTRFIGPLYLVSFRDCAILGALLGLVVLARLDQGIFVFILSILLVLFNRSSLSHPEGRRKFALVFGITLALIGPYFIYNYVTTGYFVPVSGVIKEIWSQKSLLEATHQQTYFQAKLENLVRILSIQKDYFWSLVGSALIVWILLVRHRIQAHKTLLPFIFGPLLIFGYYIFVFHYPFNANLSYYQTIWLAGLLTLGLVIDTLLDQFRFPGGLLSQGILIGGLIVLIAFLVLAQFEQQQTFYQGIRIQSFAETYKYLSWRAAEYIQSHVWSPGPDDQVTFASADAGVLGFLLDEPVVNLDGLINNEILDYEQQDKQWNLYVIDKSEIDYVVNVFKEEWYPPPLFAEHFTLCQIGANVNPEKLRFRIYGRYTSLSAETRDSFDAGCIPGQISTVWAGEMLKPNPLHLAIETSNQTSPPKLAMPVCLEENNALLYQPTFVVPAGIYELDIFMSVNDVMVADRIAQVNIATQADQVFLQHSITTKDFQSPGEYQRITIPFRLSTDHDDLVVQVMPINKQGACLQGVRLVACQDGCINP
jgi:hypothetical protein